MAPNWAGSNRKFPFGFSFYPGSRRKDKKYRDGQRRRPVDFEKRFCQIVVAAGKRSVG
jgi:hypothetical protein